MERARRRSSLLPSVCGLRRRRRCSGITHSESRGSARKLSKIPSGIAWISGETQEQASLIFAPSDCRRPSRSRAAALELSSESLRLAYWPSRSMDRSIDFSNSNRARRYLALRPRVPRNGATPTWRFPRSMNSISHASSFANSGERSHVSPGDTSLRDFKPGGRDSPEMSAIWEMNTGIR